MHITFLTYGTDGDTRPLLALARDVIARGHEAHVLADVAGAPHAQALGIPFSVLPGDMRAAFLPGGAFSALMKDGADMTRLMRACAALARDHTRPWMEAACAVAQGSDALVYSGLAGFVGLAVAEGLGIPCIGAAMWPMMPTRAFAPPFLPMYRMPGWANLLAHRAFERLAWSMFGPELNRARKQVFGAAPRRRPWRDVPMLYGCSPTLLARPADWPAGVEITGVWALPAGQDWTAGRHCATFSGPGPRVYIGFGSMAGIDQATLIDAVGAVAAGRRVLFHPGWSGIDPARLPPGVFVLGDTPHDGRLPAHGARRPPRRRRHQPRGRARGRAVRCRCRSPATSSSGARRMAERGIAAQPVRRPGSMARGSRRRWPPRRHPTCAPRRGARHRRCGTKTAYARPSTGCWAAPREGGASAHEARHVGAILHQCAERAAGNAARMSPGSTEKGIPSACACGAPATSASTCASCPRAMTSRARASNGRVSPSVP
ncbi:glycosyltransferase [Massilia phosphatilytica]